MDTEQAAKYLGVTVRTLERYKKSGKLTARLSRIGRTQKSFYDVAELDALKAELQAEVITPKVEPPKHTTNPSGEEGKANRHTDTLRPGRADSDSRSALVVRNSYELPELLAAALRPPESVHDLSLKLFLTLAEASRFSGLSIGYLKTAIQAGTLKARKVGRSWKVKPDELKELARNL